MKAILIDPEKKLISLVEYTEFQAIYEMLQCTTVEAIRFREDGGRLFPNNDKLYVDEEPFTNGKTRYVFKIGDRVLAGRGAVVGEDSDSDGPFDVSVNSDLMTVADMVEFENEPRRTKQDIIRVLRIIEYKGPRDEVERLVGKSIQGTKTVQDMTITVTTLGTFPEILGRTE